MRACDAFGFYFKMCRGCGTVSECNEGKKVEVLRLEEKEKQIVSLSFVLTMQLVGIRFRCEIRV